jgi:hypothetical protein
MALAHAVNSELFELYQYSPLDEEAQEIRLLTLLPGAFSSEIRLCLDITPFTESHVPNFEAVSYTWGSAENKKNIFIGESGRKTLAVTQNLAEALPYFRYEDKPRVLWLDAICVDQKKFKERGQQVKRMANLYSKAAKVLVWLGPESDDSPLALDLFEEIASNVMVDETTLAVVPIGNDASWAHADLEPPLKEVELLAIYNLIHQPWFERLWIWQEVHLASGNTKVMCGSRTIPWASLRAAVVCLRSKPTPEFAQEQEFGDRINRVYMLCTGTDGQSIDKLIEQSKHCACSDPRDKIYALLSLLDDATPTFGIEPDYTKSAHQAYQNAVLSFDRLHEKTGSADHG